MFPPTIVSFSFVISYHFFDYAKLWVDGVVGRGGRGSSGSRGVGVEGVEGVLEGPPKLSKMSWPTVL